MTRCLPDYERLSLDFNFDDDTTVEFNLENCPGDTKEQLALHGAVQLVAAAANRADDHESAFEYADDALCYINEFFPCKRQRREPQRIVIRALAQVNKWPLEQASLKWGELSLEKQDRIRNHRGIKAEIAWIRAERAQQYASSSATSRRKHYTHEILTAERKAKLHFSNGKDLEIGLENVSSVSALAVFGAKQKVADSYAGEHLCQDKIESARQMIRALYRGQWTAKRVETDVDAPARLALELVDCLVIWMRWPRSAVEGVVRQFDESDQTMLLNPGSKQVLAKCALEAGLKNNSGGPSPREMCNLIDEVINRLGAATKHQEGLPQ